MTPLPENLPGLFAEMLDGELDEASRRELEALIRDNAEVRRLYLEFCAMHALLQWEHGAVKGLERTPLAPARETRPAPRRIIRWSAAAAALVALAVLLAFASPLNRAPESGDVPEHAAPEISDTVVAQITGCKETRFSAAPGNELQEGSQLKQGQLVALASGFAEITFNCGAQVVLEGPAVLEVGSAWGGALKEGILRANVPPQAIGFRISAPSVDVIDLGTEFSLVAEPSGATEVFVLTGAVKAEQTGPAPVERPMILTRSQSRRFAHNGSSVVADAEKKAKRWEKVVEFERLTAARDYLHVAFDEKGGKALRVDSVGRTSGSLDVHIKRDDGSPPARTSGCFGNALRLDGDAITRIPIAGLGTVSARTFSFWMKVEPGGSLSGSDVLGWARKDPRSGTAQSIEIGWNKNPEQGALSALRVGRGRGFIIGSTPLRDGQWHHIAVVIIPDDASSGTVNVNLYVDGRLEGITSKKNKQRRAEATETLLESNEDTPEFLFIGRGAYSKDIEKFRGEIDELYIVESALSPTEIQRLLSSNDLRDVRSSRQ